MSGVIQGLYFQILELELMLETEKWERTKLEESINLEMEERKELERILQLDWDLNTKLDVYYIELIESMLEVAKQKNEILEDQCCKLVDKVNSLSKQLYVTDQKKESYLRSYRECLQEKHILKCDIYQNNLLAKELKEKLGYCYENNGNLSLATRENMSDILKQVNEMCQSLKLMGKARIRRIDTIVKIKNKLGEYETLFYINNLLLDQEVRGFCNKINNILNDWEDYYRRYNWRETAKPVENQELYQIAEISSILKYITLYKVFDSSPKDIMHIDDVYNLLIDRCVFSTNYRLSRFRKEIKFLVENEKIENDMFIISRMYPGDTFCYGDDFGNLDYNFTLMKTYKKAKILYVFGDYSTKIYKIGVTFNSLSRRFMEAEEVYRFRFPNGILKELKVISNNNAFNLELYVKKKFINKRNSLFKSTEWFTLQDNEVSYLLNEGYLQDDEFMKIYNYNF
ncbi:GIY-YIG nuclease family protein [Bacillus cereus group sp. TH43LC]|uniref:GIY-YIG nuclease family protein n=1 Tax=unclassified Bacillus cereus group TaxID=2750818 RepID=UPI000945BB84|nr:MULTISPECIES: GIY-YIG nuclease family protein [unclassified Bacillus cereus group]MDA1501599.1 GIY-YIG nuclease family protein [Bacillus cereus group sp. TH43LC]MDA2237194.1 GIY-YIG nuclease family protein [Bacillus cereus group sp. Bc222]